MITKIALVAGLILGTASVAFASEFDGNLQNRYPQAITPTFQTSNVGLAGSHAAVGGEQAWIDRASRSFGGGY